MVVSEQCFYDCFVQIVGLHSQMEQISASSVEKVCFYSYTSTHNAHLTFFVANSQTTCMNTERSRVNDEFFVHLQCKVLETQRLHQILLIKAELEASFNEQEVSKYYFNRHFNDQEILTFLSECHHHSLSYSTLLQQQGNEGENMSQITGRMMGH